MKYLSLILLTLLLCQCKKEKPVVTDPVVEKLIPDTLKPLSYFPVYPGSHWNYLENDVTPVAWTTSSTYLPHSYALLDDSGYTDTVYVPFLNDKPIYQYNKLDFKIAPFGNVYTPWPIISEELGFQYEKEWTDKRYGDFSEKLVVAQKTVNANLDSIIVVKGHWVWGPNTSKVSTQIYTKNVGLTYSDVVDTVAMQTIYKLELTDYFINH